MARVLVAYASGTGCDSNCAVDIAEEIAGVPDLQVDAMPMRRVNSIEPYSAVYVGWVHPSEAGRRELERFLRRNAALVVDRPVWIIHHHPQCSRNAGPPPMKMTRLVITPQVAEERRFEAAIPGTRAPAGRKLVDA